MNKLRNNDINKSLNQSAVIIGNKKLNRNNIFCICIAFYYVFAVLTRIQSVLIQRSSVLANIIRFGTYGLILFVLLGLISSTKRFAALIFLEFVLGVLFLCSVTLGNIGNTDWLNVYQLIATTYIPLALAAYYNTDKKMLMKALYLVVVVSVPILIAIAILTYSNWEHSYDMSLGYIMAFSALILLAQFTIDSRIYNIILAILLSVFILFIGSRGPFICIISFVFIELFLSQRYKKKRAIIIIGTCIAIGAICINFENIITFVYNISVNFGFNSRSIRLLLEGEAISHDSGRNTLQEYYLQLIHKEPFGGYGVMGAWKADSMYPHNIILEFLLAFGYIGGVPLLMILLILFVSAVRKSKDRYNNALIVIFISYCMHLFVSGTYLKVWQFFVCIALCIPNKRNDLLPKRKIF